MRIYLDTCCLNRLFDDLSADIVRMEAEAILSIVDKCEEGDWAFFSSDVLFDEIDSMPNLVRKQKVLLLFHSAERHIDLTSDIIARANQFKRFNIKAYDALHLASAEAGHADVFLTTDRKLLNAAKRSDITIEVKNPLVWLTEVLYNEH